MNQYIPNPASSWCSHYQIQSRSHPFCDRYVAIRVVGLGAVRSQWEESGAEKEAVGTVRLNSDEPIGRTFDAESYFLSAFGIAGLADGVRGGPLRQAMLTDICRRRLELCLVGDTTRDDLPHEVDPTPKKFFALYTQPPLGIDDMVIVRLDRDK